MAGSLLMLPVIFGVLSAQYLPARVPIAVLFQPEDDHLHRLALRYAMQHINLKQELQRGTELYMVELNMLQEDSLRTGELVCSAVEDGVAAVFGPLAPRSMGIVQSVCETLEIPNVQIYPEVYNKHNYPDVPEYQRCCHINLYPAQESVAQAIVDVVRDFLRWSAFTLLYESDEGLMRLQEVLKTNKTWDPNITVRQFLPGGDQRELLKGLNDTNVNILLDCATDSVLPVLRNARELRMISDYHSYFITSLDTHTLDFSEFRTDEGNRTVNVSITLLRLVDPKNDTVQHIIKSWAQEEGYNARTLRVTPDTLRTEVALMHDAVFLFARTLNRLHVEGERNFDVEKLECDGDHKSSYGFAHANFMKLFQMDGMTGNIQIDSSGRRSQFKLDVVEYFTGKFKKMGTWETGRGVNRTVSVKEKEQEIQKSLQFKTFKVVSRIGLPFLIKNENSSLEGNDRYMGYSMDLLKEIFNLLNSSFEVNLVKSNKHDDLVKELVARNADLAICDLTITQEREHLIDFTMPFMNLGISILYSKPIKEETRLFAFFDPFSIDVWIYVATAYLGVSILLFVLAR